MTAQPDGDRLAARLARPRPDAREVLDGWPLDGVLASRPPDGRPPDGEPPDGEPPDGEPPDGGSLAAAVGGGHRPGPAWLPGDDFAAHVPGSEADRIGRGGFGGALASRRGRIRWDPGHRAAAALGLAVVVVVAATGWWLAASRPREVPLAGPAGGARSSSVGTAAGPAGGPVASGSSVPGGPGSAAAHPTAAAGGQLVVDVAGKVRRPGVYRLAAGSRVYDALRAAGGARPGVSTLPLNLAEPLRDGEQVVVGAPNPAGAGPPAAQPPTARPPGAAVSAVALNTATLDQLEALPGVGPVLGQHILDWRDAHGRFTSIDQLQDVSGIGPAKFAAMKDQVTL